MIAKKAYSFIMKFCSMQDLVEDFTIISAGIGSCESENMGEVPISSPKA